MRYLIVGLMLCSLSACMSRHVIIAQRTVVGVDLSLNTQTPSGSFNVGYDRRALSVVPRSEVKSDSGTTEYEALSTLSCTKIRAGDPDKVHTTFSENIATGNAAIDYSKAFVLNPGDSPFSCFANEGGKK